MFCARAQSLPCVRPSHSFEAHLLSENVYLPARSKPTRPKNVWRNVVPCNDNVPAIIAPGRVPGNGKSACLGVVPFSSNVLGTDVLLKPSRKTMSACPAIVAFYDNVKRTAELLRPTHREQEGWLIDYNQWDRSRSPKMLSIALVEEVKF